jgi:hypothetical protein
MKVFESRLSLSHASLVIGDRRKRRKERRGIPNKCRNLSHGDKLMPPPFERKSSQREDGAADLLA